MWHNFFVFTLFFFVSTFLKAETVDLTDLSGVDQTHVADPVAAADQASVEALSEKKQDADHGGTTVEKSMVTETSDEAVNVENAGAEQALQFLNLKPNAWKDVTREEIHRLIEKIPNHMSSRLLMRLARNFLLAPLEVPKQKQGGEGDLNTIILRAQKLHDMGFLKDAFDLLQAHHSLQTHALYQKLKFEKDLMAGHPEGACHIPSEKIKQGGALYWQKAQITCQVLQGKIPEARLSLEVFAEERGQTDKDFISAVQVHLEPELAQYTPDMKAPDILGLILVSKIPGGLTQETLVNFPLLVRLYLEANLGDGLSLSPSAKLDIYEEALDMMFIGEDALRQAYLDYYADYKKQQQGKEVDFKALATTLTPESRAVLYGYAMEHMHQEEVADKVLLALIANALRSNQLRPVSKLLGEKIRSLEPKEGMARYIDLITLAGAFSGEYNVICPWQFYVSAATKSQTLPFVFMACPVSDASYRNEQIAGWFERFHGVHKEHLPEFHRYAATLFSILESLGIPVPKALWQKIPALPDDQLMDINLVDKALIERSVKDKSGAELVARLLNALGKTEEIWTREALLFTIQKLTQAGNKDLALQFALDLAAQVDLAKTLPA